MDQRIARLIGNIEKVIVGKTVPITKIITAMLCEGHVLIEDVPGVGKTQLVSALARSVDGKFNRIQLTPDIMPSDIVGFSMVNQVT
ncbi:MAG: AAA family ATPase, partial [Ruminococcus sp.]|nr:AAA family ATPase [Ruminococcus sp.]